MIMKNQALLSSVNRIFMHNKYKKHGHVNFMTCPCFCYLCKGFAFTLLVFAFRLNVYVLTSLFSGSENYSSVHQCI